MSHSHINQGHPRFAELDGLRALAVVSVILFHCNISGLSDAGFFGVDVFFTISGFIITALLAKEYRENRDFRFRAFYFRRLKRLLPPVFALLMLAAFTFFISDTGFAAFKDDMPAALAYGSNWWQIIEKQSYFDKTPHVLKHLWSLAVEEQFYFLWPPIAYFFLKRFGPKTTGMVALLLACASTAWMYQLYDPNIDVADQARIYLGTDTHAMGLLAGAALACFWNPWIQPNDSLLARNLRRLAVCLSLGGLGYMIHVLNPSHPFLYRGGFLLVPVLTGVVAYGTMNDQRFLVSRLLQANIVQWLGSRSYSLYLVHWLIFVWMQLRGFDDFSQPPVLGAALAAVAVLSELMYRMVEVPSKNIKLQHLSNRRMALCVIAYSTVAWSIFGVALGTRGEVAPTLAVAAPTVALATGPVAPAANAPAASAAVPVPVPDEPDDADQMIDGGEDIYAIGDSVLLGAKEQLLKTIPGIRVDAEVGRQASQGLNVIRKWRKKSGKASTIVLHLGTNGYINETQFRELLSELADRKSVIVINVHANRRWTAPNNELIGRLRPEFPNMRIIDWSAVSSGRADYFVNDGIHLTTKGLRALTTQIMLASGGAVIAPTKDDTMLASGNSTRGSRRPAPKPAAVADKPAFIAPEASTAPTISPAQKAAEVAEAAKAPAAVNSESESKAPAPSPSASPETARPD
ncbi:MAG TPA: hypothetical protein DCW29_10405 [Janthinobacterium sp.]|nr:hypothetical protein [Janthinobacterium sp.]